MDIRLLFALLFGELFAKSKLSLQWYIPVLLWWVLVPFGFQHLQRLDQFLTRFSWLDDRIHKAPLRSHIRIGKAIAKFFNLALAHERAGNINEAKKNWKK